MNEQKDFHSKSMDGVNSMNTQDKRLAVINFLEKNSFDFSIDDQTLTMHSSDASAFVVKPSIVVYPRNKMEIQALLREVSMMSWASGSKIVGANENNLMNKIKSLFSFSNKNSGQGSIQSKGTSRRLGNSDITISVRAGGTCMSGGSLNTGIMLNMTKYMNSFDINYNAKNAIVEMGVMYRDLEAKMKVHNLFFPGYTSSKDICGIGGMIGNNASGEKSILYGATIDNVESVKVVLTNGEEYEFGKLTAIEFTDKQKLQTAEGKIYRSIARILNQYANDISAIKRPVPKCASGYRIERVYNPKDDTYNLAPLFVGSQATLGIVTSAKIKLHSFNPEKRLLAIPVDALDHLPIILKTVMTGRPESVETFDINTLRSATKFKQAEGQIAMQCFGPETHLIILAEFTGHIKDDVDNKAKGIYEAIVKETGMHPVMVTDESHYDALWAIRRSSFGAMRDDVQGTMHAIPCIEDIIVPIDKFDIFIPELLNILESRGINYGFHGHIGDGALRVIPVFDMADRHVVKKITELSRSVFTLVNKLGGNMSADHSDGIIRSPFLEEFYGAKIYDMFIDIKNIFDPLNICNPRKKVGGTVKEIEKYIIRR